MPEKKSVRATVKSKVGGALTKVNKGADWLGLAGGYFGTLITGSRVYGGENDLENLVNVHVNAVTVHDFGKVLQVPSRHMQDAGWNPLLLTGVIMTVGGTIAKYLPSIIPHQATVAGIVTKAGYGMAIGSGLAMGVAALAESSNPFAKKGSNSGSNSTSAVWMVPKSSSISNVGMHKKPTASLAFSRPAR